MTKSYTTNEKVMGYNSCINVFNQLFKELKELTKKKPDTTLSKTKVKIINRVLDDVRAFLDGEPEYKYLDTLDDDDLPQYGDAVLILSQYEGAITAFRDRHYGWSGHNQRWFIDNHDESEFEDDVEDSDVASEEE
jgi:hypothetical protein